MDIGRSFSYVFEDTDWLKKVLIGGLINLIPIVNFAAMGYGIEQIRRVYDGRELPLPEWDNFGGYFVKGLMTTVAGLVYSIPAILIWCCAFILPATLFPTSTSSGRSSTSGGPLETLLPILVFCGVCLIVLYSLALLFLFPALMARYAITEQFNAFFQFGAAWQLINTNIGQYLVAVLVWVIVLMIASTIGSIACFIGQAWTGFWASLVGSYLFGTFARGTAAPTSVAPVMPA